MALYGSGGYGSGGYGGGFIASPDGGPILTLPASYYLALLTSEYQASANLKAWVSALIQPLLDAAQLAATMSNYFDLDYAVGAQLDIIGSRIGQSRTVGFQPSKGVSPVLDEDTYRLLLKATVARNYWDGTIDGLQSTWQSLFPGGRITIQDHQDMTATIILSGSFTSVIQDLITNGYIVPKPQAVRYNYIFPVLPMLGFDQNNAYLAGIGTGHFV